MKNGEERSVLPKSVGSTAGHKLFGDQEGHQTIQASPALHLRTSNRSLRADQLATWVNRVIDGDAEGAASLGIPDKFPIFLTRSLDDARFVLRENARGLDRYGLIGSSGAARLRAEGLEPSSTFHADYPWEHWYLSAETDVRSSYRCEVFATEFEIQGLELDWIALCWGGDFIWNEVRKEWQLRKLHPAPQTKWTVIKSVDKQGYRRNAYRVLLTRARKGMVLFIPKGNPLDPTNPAADFDSTSAFLLRCGVTPFQR